MRISITETALQKYGRHLAGCEGDILSRIRRFRRERGPISLSEGIKMAREGRLGYEDDCTCGLDAVLKSDMGKT